jgi:hypothetical protein
VTTAYSMEIRRMANGRQGMQLTVEVIVSVIKGVDKVSGCNGISSMDILLNNIRCAEVHGTVPS